MNFSVCWYDQRETDLTEVLSCLYVSSLISCRPLFSGLGKYDDMLAQEEADSEDLSRGFALHWVSCARERSVNGDKSSSQGSRSHSPLKISLMRLRRGFTAVPENHYPISSSPNEQFALQYNTYHSLPSDLHTGAQAALVVCGLQSQELKT